MVGKLLSIGSLAFLPALASESFAADAQERISTLGELGRLVFFLLVASIGFDVPRRGRDPA